MYAKFYVECGENEQCSKFKAEKENTKQEQSKHNPYKKSEAGSGSMYEWASSANRSHPPCAVCRNRENEKHHGLFSD